LLRATVRAFSRTLTHLLATFVELLYKKSPFVLFDSFSFKQFAQDFDLLSFFLPHSQIKASELALLLLGNLRLLIFAAQDREQKFARVFWTSVFCF
jgi:hypothetical protein